MPKLSIVIITLDEEKNLPKLLGSIKAQTFTDYEIVVADYDSKDRTRVIAEEGGARVVRGGTVSVGRNNGARVVRGDILLFLDADVELPDKKFLERALREFDRRKLDIASVLLNPISKKIIDKLMHELYNVYTIAVQKFIPHVPGFFIFVRRRIHEQIGGFDETLTFAEDHEYARRASKVGKFGFLHHERIGVSIRRFDRDGRATVALKYLLGEFYLITKGKVPSGVMEYTFGYDEAVKKESPLKKLWKKRKTFLEKESRK